MQYTIRNIPVEMDQALRRLSKSTGKSINQLALESLRQTTGIGEGRKHRKRRVSDLVGKHQFDAGFDRTLKQFDRVDPELWS
jgi:hypothetical protein